LGLTGANSGLLSSNNTTHLPLSSISPPRLNLQHPHPHSFGSAMSSMYSPLSPHPSIGAASNGLDSGSPYNPMSSMANFSPHHHHHHHPHHGDHHHHLLSSGASGGSGSMSPSPGLCLQQQQQQPQQQQQHREMTPPSPYQCPPPPTSINHSAYDPLSLGYPPRHHSPNQNVGHQGTSGGGYTMNGTLTAYGSIGSGSSAGNFDRYSLSERPTVSHSDPHLFQV
jgi:hypothetical protein